MDEDSLTTTNIKRAKTNDDMNVINYNNAVVMISEVLDNLKLFVNEIKVDTGKDVLVVRSDNGSEFTSKNVKCKKMEIAKLKEDIYPH
ncbi:hypothetical protein DERF_011248 [Dermatophagoides farinae]|uniref:Uncharacterized protein n=1 Tax=Dermatophagoides farinae TaxID=6954 RepID=A0A922HSN4_DERFA|nr:hypothetical protein DERF_011248 [Dermatophagoides farinae]